MSAQALSTAVALRRLCVTDLAVFQAYRNDPQVASYQEWKARSGAEARDFFIDVHALARP